MPTALSYIGQYLGVAPESSKPDRHRSTSQSRKSTNRATRSPRPTEPVSEPVQESQRIESDITCESTMGTSRQVAPSGLRHDVYSIALSGLKLSDAHRAALCQRGLTDVAIETGGYRSVVAPSNMVKSSVRLREWVNEAPTARLDLALTVPGVIQDEGKPLRFSSPCGLLIPVRDSARQIMALRIRPDAPGEGGKYRWISSRSRKLPDLPSPGTPCHVPNGITVPVDELRITEGELKADIAFCLSGIPTISIPGVSCWKRVLPLIREFQPKKVRIGLDADFCTNVAVASALQGLVSALSILCEVAVETWPPVAGKGIDEVLASGFIPTLVQESDLQLLLAKLPSSVGTRKCPPIRTEVILGTDEHRVNDAAVAALAGDAELYVRAGMLTRMVEADTFLDGIVRPGGSQRIGLVPPQSLREAMTRQIHFIEQKMDRQGDIVAKPVHPPGWCVSAVHARGTWPGIRPLRAIVTCPILRPDGTIMSANGYDPMTGLYLSTTIDLPRIPPQPTQDDAVRASKRLLNVVVDFPFAKPEHRAAWLAFALTPLARFAFCGPSPLFLIDANTRGSGKSLLADVCGTIATGTTMSRMVSPKDDDECRKRITALAIAGDSMVLIDNVIGNLGCASLDAALTAPDSWKDRILGKSEMVDLPLSLVWAATGNNMVLEADTSRRSLHIRLDSPLENPELRTNFQHPNLIEFVKRERATLVAAGLTILSGYHAAGRPRMNLPAWGSFDVWSALVREAIVWCGLSDPGDTREELAKRCDLIKGVLQILISEWPQIDPDGTGLTASRLLLRLEERRIEHQSICAAICELCHCTGDKLPTTRSLGNHFKKFCGRTINGKALDSDDVHGTARWVVRPVTKRMNSCSGWTGGSTEPPIEESFETPVSTGSPESTLA